MLTDTGLINGYAQDRSESAFTELVQRHVNLVYSVALRETAGQTAPAEHLTQRSSPNWPARPVPRGRTRLWRGGSTPVCAASAPNSDGNCANWPPTP